MNLLNTLTSLLNDHGRSDHVNVSLDTNRRAQHINSKLSLGIKEDLITIACMVSGMHDSPVKAGRYVYMSDDEWLDEFTLDERMDVCRAIELCNIDRGGLCELISTAIMPRPYFRRLVTETYGVFRSTKQDHRTAVASTVDLLYSTYGTEGCVVYTSMYERYWVEDLIILRTLCDEINFEIVHKSVTSL